MAKKSFSKRRARGDRKVVDAIATLSHAPPPFSPEDIVSTSFRYYNSATNGNIPFHRSDMLNLLVFGVNSTTAYRMFGAIKVKAVHIWSGGYSAANVTTYVNSSNIQWNGSDTRNKTVSTSSMGPSAISSLTSKPPPGSLAAKWSIDNQNESEILFTCDLSFGDIVQFDVVYQLQNNVTAGFTSNAYTSTTTLATGIVYATAPDHAASALMFPIGRRNAQ